MNREFISILNNELGERLDFLVYGKTFDNMIEVRYTEDPETVCIWESYNNLVDEIDTIKTKYNIISDEDIRIVFAFDC